MREPADTGLDFETLRQGIERRDPDLVLGFYAEDAQLSIVNAEARRSFPFNAMSWYIRPLFLLPFCYFAYKHSLTGIVLTLVALATSMFWFPASETTSPAVREMLAAEEEYLTTDWTLWKVLIALLVPDTAFLEDHAYASPELRHGAHIWLRALCW